MQHTKRYGIVFDKWSIYHYHRDITEYDTLKEVNEEAALIDEMYKDTPRPEHKYAKWNRYCNTKSTAISDYAWCAENFGEAFWGYLIVDFEEEKIIRWGHDCLRSYNKESDVRRVKDFIFRGDDEVPKDYKWDVGEYDGWLQYRWGNGKNSIKYGDDAIIDTKDCGKVKCSCMRHCSRTKKKKFATKEYNEAEDAYLDKLNAEILAEVGTEKVLS